MSTTKTIPAFTDRSTDKFFSYKDWREQLQFTVKNCSYVEAERMYCDGRISAHVWECFCRIWDWLSFRASDWNAQEKFWAKYGKRASLAKINKTRAAFGFEPMKDTFGDVIVW